MAEQEPRQMRLVESEEAQRYPIVSHIVISQHVLAHEDKYREDQLKDARDTIAFWSQMASVEEHE